MKTTAHRLLVAWLVTTASVGFSAASADPEGSDWFSAGSSKLAELKRGGGAGRAKNVILFVGDGMGVSTVTAARILDGQQRGGDGESHRLAFERFPHLAMSVTASANQQTSDSAPTATAMVAGIKANDGALSVAPTLARNQVDAERVAAASVATVLEMAELRGLATGLVTTARVTHATPAANYAHLPERNWEADSDLPTGATVKDIARQLLESPYGDGPEVVLGGGRRSFYNSGTQDPEYPEKMGGRSDGRNLHSEWLASREGAKYIWSRDQFVEIKPSNTKRLLGLFEPSHMRFELDRSNDVAGEPSLAEMTRKAIELLSQDSDGYYLMVEAGRIDHGHHAGNAKRALTDTIALSEAVAVAQALVGDDTLIVVTADHSHVFTIAGYPSRGNPILGLADSNGTPAKDALGLPYTTLGYANGPGYAGGGERREFDGTSQRHVDGHYPGNAMRPDLREIDTANDSYLQESAVPMYMETHAGEDVAIYAVGPNAALFRGVLEQNVIFHIIADALGL